MSIHNIDGRGKSSGWWNMTMSSLPRGYIRIYLDVSLYNTSTYKVDITLEWDFGDENVNFNTQNFLDTRVYGWIWRIWIKNGVDSDYADFYWREFATDSSHRDNYGYGYVYSYAYNGFSETKTLYIDRDIVSSSSNEYLEYSEQLVYVSGLSIPTAAYYYNTQFGNVTQSIKTGYTGRFTQMTINVSSPKSGSVTMIKHNDSFKVTINKCVVNSDEYNTIVAKMNNRTKTILETYGTYYAEYGSVIYTLYGNNYSLSAGKEYTLSLYRGSSYAQFNSPTVNRTYRTYSVPNISFSLDSYYDADEIIKFKVNEWRGNFGTEDSYCSIHAYNGSKYVFVDDIYANEYVYNSSVLNMGNNVIKSLEKVDGQNNKAAFEIDRISELDTASYRVNTKIYFKPTNTPSFSYGYFKYTNGTVSNKSLSTTVSTKGTSINCINIPVTYTGRGYVNGYQVFVRQNNNSSIVNNFHVSATNNRSKNFETNISINANTLTSTRQYSIDIRPYYVYETNSSKGYGSNYTINNAIYYLTPSNAGIGCNTFTSSGVWVGKNMILYFQLPKDANYFSLVDTERSNYRYQDVIVNIVTYNNNSYTYKYSTHKQYFDCNDELTYGKYLNFNIGLTDIPKNVMIKQCNISVVYSSKTDGTTHKFKVINMRDWSDVLYNGVYNSRTFTYDGTVTLLEKFVNYTEDTIIENSDIRHLFHILYGMIMYVREVLIYQPYYYTYTTYYYDNSYNNISSTHYQYKNQPYYGSTLETIIESLKNLLSDKYREVISVSSVSYGTMLLYLLGYTYERTINAQNKNFNINYMSDYYEYYNNYFSYPSVLDKNRTSGNTITLEEYKIIAQCLLNIVKGIETVL